MMEKNKIELNPAWTWDCDDCGRENFARSISAVFTEAECIDMRKHMGLEADEWKAETPTEFVEKYGWQMQPDNVKCAHCGASFEVLFEPLDDGAP